MAQEIRVAYKDADKNIQGFIGAEIVYEVIIGPALAEDGVLIAPNILSFDDDYTITNADLLVDSNGVASKA
jgi:hypothetical protein|tara:strand:- start:51 stop:263 length:213 start_codon:yes stop_codon:yes gene_type:complete